MSSIATSVGARRVRRRRLGDRLADEALVITFLGTLVALLAAASSPYLLQPDSWLTFVGGREIAAHGVPRIDSLAIMSHGHRWIDQQWLGQLLTYRLVATVGIGATLAIFTALVIAPVVLACGLARRRASARSVALFGVLAFPMLFCAVRTQAFSFLLFVPFFALLCSESRRATRRVWLALPVLALWANLHGAVVVAAALVALLGATDFFAGRRLRGAGLVAGATASIFATPYGFGIVGYYASTMGNPLFRKYITEWQSPTFAGTFMPFFVAAGFALVLVARRPRSLTFFEMSALALTLVGGLMAQRSVIWFSDASLLLLPAVLDEVWPARRLASSTRTALAGLATLWATVALVVIAHAVSVGGRKINVAYPPAAVQAVRAAIAADPTARVLADDRTADWLLYKLPQLGDRIAFDGRWEVLSQPQFALVRNYVTQQEPDPGALMRRYQILVVDRTWHPKLYRWYEAMRGLRVLYRGSRVAVYVR